MLLSIICLGLIAGVALYQSTQGAFSALLMCVLTICCAALAMGTYEWVAVNWLAPMWRPEFAHAIALAAVFGVPLIVMRLGFDRIVRRSPILPLWLDRVGAGACGLVTSLLMVGTFVNCLMLVPFGPDVLGFARVPAAAQVAESLRPQKSKEAKAPAETRQEDPAQENDVLFTPDRFAVRFIAMLSDGVLGTGRSFGEIEPDWVRATGWVSAAPSEVSRYVPPGSISVVRTEPVPFVYKETPPPSASRHSENVEPAKYDPVDPQRGYEFQMVRVKLKNDARDSRKSHVFTLRQFRLVGHDAEERLQQYHACAIQQDVPKDAPDIVNRHIRFKKLKAGDIPLVDTPFSPRDGNDNEVEVVFEVPKGFVPSYIAYKRGARAPVSFTGSGAHARSTPTELPVPAGSQSSTQAAAPSTPPTGSSGGNIRRFTVRSSKSFFGDEMPAQLTAYRKLKNAEVAGGRMKSGHLVAFADEQEGGKDPQVGRFVVPEDKRLLQLGTEYLKARSGLGRAISFAVGTLENYFVEDSSGNRYELVGKYAIADVEGRQAIEIQYFSEKTGSMGQLGKFDKIQDRHLSGEYEYALLFLVDPGAQIVAFNTGGAASRRNDLSGDNLVAPE